MIFLLLIIIQVAVFAALILILKSVLKQHFGTAASHLDALTQDAERHLLDAKNKVGEADAYYNDVIAKAKADSEKVRQQFLDEGIKGKQDLLDLARKESDAIMERARSAKKLLEENWDQELTEKACEVAYQSLQAILPEKVSQSLQDDWVNKTLALEFEGLKHLHIPGEVDKAEVVSALPLNESQKKTLREMLKKKIGKIVEIDEKVDKRLVLGFRISLGTVVIDSSLIWKLKEALRNDSSKKNS